ncbi:MAG: hypothetical protein K9M11_03805 [Candidatus Pacebacteria bacterium]|nr:hypothetical protein [Candidatus Paceibacterota bacterium]
MARKISKKRSQEILNAIYTILSFFWMRAWVERQANDPGKSSKETPVGRITYREILEKMRKSPEGGIDASREPERALTYSTIRQTSEPWIWVWLGMFLLCSISTVNFAVSVFCKGIYKDSTNPYVVYYALFLCALCTLVLLYKTIQTIRDYRRHRISEASEYLGSSWSLVRGQFSKIGIVSRILEEAVRCEQIGSTFVMNSQHPITAMALGAYIKSIFLKLLADEAVPYVKNQRNGKDQSTEGIQVKERFETVVSLIPYFCPGADVNAISQQACSDALIHHEATDKVPAQ